MRVGARNPGGVGRQVPRRPSGDRGQARSNRPSADRRRHLQSEPLDAILVSDLGVPDLR